MIELILLVKCPDEKCQATRKTTSVKRIQCFSCGKKFPVFDKKAGRSNIVSIVKGNRMLLTKRLYKEGIYGKKRTD